MSFASSDLTARHETAGPVVLPPPRHESRPSSASAAETAVTYSVVVPVYGNEATIPALLSRLATLSREIDGGFEAVFVVDGSPDGSLLLLRRLLPDSGLQSQLVTLSRNYGSFAAIRAGLAVARGEYVAVMAADLQKPVSLVEDIFRQLSTGEFDVAVGVRAGRNDPALSSAASRAFWGFYRRYVQKDLPAGGVDMFGCTRQVVTQLLQLEESNTSLVGLLYWLGFRRAEVPYERQEREHGTSGWTLKKKLRYMNGTCKESTCRRVLAIALGTGQRGEELGRGGEPGGGRCGDVAVLVQERGDFAQHASDGAATDFEQLGDGVVGAQAAPLEHGGQHSFGVGDLLHEDAAAGAGQPFAAAQSMPMALGAGGEHGHDPVGQRGEVGPRHAGQRRVGEPFGQPRAGRVHVAA